jgi:hypothetical protein
MAGLYGKALVSKISLLRCGNIALERSGTPQGGGATDEECKWIARPGALVMIHDLVTY